MRLTDANLLIYAIDASSPHHTRARRWLETSLSGTDPFAFTWSVLLAFLRIVTNPRVSASALSVSTACDVVDGWLAEPVSRILQPTARHARVLRELLEPLGTAGNLTGDAHLAAVAIEHGAELCSADGDFARFPGLRWVNPLTAS